MKLRKQEDFNNGQEVICKIKKKMIGEKIPKFELDLLNDSFKND